jgi:non-specific serine/threonine protein kinase
VRAAAATAACVAVAALAGGADAAWVERAPIPVPRSEMAATTAAGRIVVAGGYTPDGRTSRRVDAYDPVRNRWTQLPDLPFGVNHPATTSYRGEMYVAGGYRADGRQTHALFILRHGRWIFGPNLPVSRGAGGAAVVGHTLVIAGGLGPHGLARAALAFDLERRRWRYAPGPAQRDHLGVTAWKGRVYAVAGRRVTRDTNLGTLQSWAPGERRWTTLPPVPAPRGGTGAAAVAGQIVSVGGETDTETIASVYAYDIARKRWRRLADLPTPRHGLGVAAVAGRVYAVAGGPVPGLSASEENEALRLRAP